EQREQKQAVIVRLPDGGVRMLDGPPAPGELEAMGLGRTTSRRRRRGRGRGGRPMPVVEVVGATPLASARPTAGAPAPRMPAPPQAVGNLRSSGGTFGDANGGGGMAGSVAAG